MSARRAAALPALLGMLACGAPRPGGADSPAAREDARAGARADAGAAAADTTGPVTLRTDASRYAPGARVGLTLVNRADARYTFNPCTRAVEREADGAWRAVEEDRLCTMEAWLLEPRATRTATTELPSTLAAGRYRLAVALTPESAAPGAQPVRAVSPPFDVAR